MVNVMLEIVDSFSLVWVLMYRNSKSAFLQLTMNFELELMNINSRHSNSNCAQHIVIHWSLFKVYIESLHYNSHQRETIHDKLIFFSKLVRQWKSKEWAKLELQCLPLIFIYSNSKCKVTCKNTDFERWYIRTHAKDKLSKISNITFAILLFYQKKKTPQN